MTSNYGDNSSEHCSLRSCPNLATHSVQVGTRRTQLCSGHARMLELMMNAKPRSRCPEARPLLESAKADLDEALMLDPSLSDARKFLADIGGLLEQC